MNWIFIISNKNIIIHVKVHATWINGIAPSFQMFVLLDFEKIKPMICVLFMNKVMQFGGIFFIQTTALSANGAYEQSFSSEHMHFYRETGNKFH